MENYSEVNLKDKYIFDTSAFLTLESIYLLDKILDLYHIITTESVIKELENFSQHEDELGLIAKRVLQKKNRLFLKEAKITEGVEHIGYIDEELFNLSKNENIILITDDLKLLRHAASKIKIEFSTYFLTDFVIGNIITKTEALQKLERMKKIRNWQDNIIYMTTKSELEKL